MPPSLLIILIGESDRNGWDNVEWGQVGHAGECWLNSKRRRVPDGGELGACSGSGSQVEALVGKSPAEGQCAAASAGTRRSSCGHWAHKTGLNFTEVQAEGCSEQLRCLMAAAAVFAPTRR